MNVEKVSLMPYSEKGMSKILRNQQRKIINTRPKFNTNYSIKVKAGKKTYFLPPQIPPLLLRYTVSKENHIQGRRKCVTMEKEK